MIRLTVMMGFSVQNGVRTKAKNHLSLAAARRTKPVTPPTLSTASTRSGRRFLTQGGLDNIYCGALHTQHRGRSSCPELDLKEKAAPVSQDGLCVRVDSVQSIGN